jgi:ATPase subunit of ABC transporter with duplicated ATPase domains
MLFAEHVAKTFGNLDVLHDVTFNVSAGERAGLVGPNGAGKSTVLRLLAGEDTPDGGTAGHRGGSLGYLKQEAGHDPARPLIDEMWTAFPGRAPSMWNCTRSPGASSAAAAILMR